jgi:type II secretory pathway component GspD/PulD (secretin)
MIAIHCRRTLARALLVCTAAAGVANIAGAQDTARGAPAAGAARMDFQDADLRAVITAIAEAGALNVTYGEMPNRRVTLHLRQNVSRADMLPLLRSVAASNGLRVVEDGNLLRVEAVDARTLAQGNAQGAGTGVQQAGVRLFVYRLRHARATRLAGTLQTIYGNRVGTDVNANLGGIQSRTLSEQLRGTQIPRLDIDTIGRGATVNAAAVLGAALQGEIQIVPDETTNSLLIRAQPADYETIRQAVEVLDLRPLQVFIEVLIAEVRHNRGLDLGITGAASRNRNGNTSTVISGSPTEPGPQDFIVRLTRGGSVSVDVALTALATRGDVRILSRPLIMAENNLEARITVGSQRPFVQVFRSLPTESAARDQVVQYRDVGTTLTLLPTINPDGYVNMQVKQEVSSATNEVAFGAPVISNREASTHLFVKDNETVVIGGLADRQVERTRSGIPILSSIPWIGGLFGGTHDADTQSELYLFLTPHIIATDEDADRVRRGTEGRLDSIDARRRDNPAVVPGAGQAPQRPTPVQKFP